MTPEVKEWMEELGFDLYGAHYEARRIPNSTMWVHTDQATFFYNQFRLRELQSRMIELDLLEQAINQGRDIIQYKLDRLADLNNQIAQLEAQKDKEV